MLWLIALMLASPEADPRIQLTRLQFEQRYNEALILAEWTHAATPQRSRDLGVSYLRGHLLTLLERPTEASGAFASAIAETPLLAPHSRLALAETLYAVDHPEMSAGILTRLLNDRPPESLFPRAVELLARTLADGGDCRLLDQVPDGLRRAQRRQIDLSRAQCALRGGRPDQARLDLVAVLDEETTDRIALDAAELLSCLESPPSTAGRDARLLGLTFSFHRQFERAALYLERALASPSATAEMTDAQEFELRYAWARSHFWRREYRRATELFTEAAQHAARPVWEAQALYNRGRSQELGGDWNAAHDSYHLAFSAEPTGRYADAALLSSLRIAWRMGRENEALGHYESLAGRRSWQGLRARGALFLAASDIVRGRTDRASGWLADAASDAPEESLEIEFWRGRLAEAEGQLETAARLYLRCLARDPYHPLAQRARARLDAEGLRDAALGIASQLANSRKETDLYAASLVLEQREPGRTAQLSLERRFRAASDSRAILEIESVPTDEWPLWRAPVDDPEELLLSLGVLPSRSRELTRYFPTQEPRLAFTGAQLLARSGRTRVAIEVAAGIIDHSRKRLPDFLLPDELRRLLYPLPYRSAIERHAARFDTDPLLIAGLIREESRFDPSAFSSASARGLAQFVLPTAVRLAAKIGLENLDPESLHDPEVSIELAAAYLHELEGRFGNRPFIQVAAYNAGEDQAQLWRSYCFSNEPAEYFTKVGFPQTRSHIRKVLSSRAHYAELY